MQQADRDAPRKAFSKPAAFVVLTKGLTLTTELTVARLRELIFYDPDTGVFTWRPGSGPRRYGSAGSIQRANGYRYIRIDGKGHRACRLAWLYVYGRWPARQIDHIDRCRQNDAIANLRDVSAAANSLNRGANPSNTSGYAGVTWHRARQRWLAQINTANGNKYLGYYDDARAASDAYQAALSVALTAALSG